MFHEKIHPPSYFFVFFFLALLLDDLFPIYEIIPDPFYKVGYLFILIGIGLGYWTLQWMKQARMQLSPYAKPNDLITTGPFQYSRNPLYLAAILVLLGEAILLRSLICFFLPFLFFRLMNEKFVLHEEEVLEMEKGDEYAAYQDSVGRWI